MIREEIIGDCRLILGDAVEEIPLIDHWGAMITDPPYGLAEKLSGGKWGKKFIGKHKDWDAAAPVASLFEDSRPTIVWGGNYVGLPASRGWLVWFKRDSVPTMADCELAWTNMDMNAKVFDWTIAATNAERVKHPTQKPIALMKWCIGFVPPAAVIFDPFMGSGSTLVACAKMGRTAIGIECDPDYFEICCRRVEEAYRQPDLFVAPPDRNPPQPQLFDVT